MLASPCIWICIQLSLKGEMHSNMSKNTVWIITTHKIIDVIHKNLHSLDKIWNITSCLKKSKMFKVPKTCSLECFLKPCS